ncbi:hypothetical protein EYW49_08935 [Siculibacillus lacustris]|uniref:Uncharacterized protein n=1 Tax=Siculibacillus lacustris TaxID=1549641 RepID=A0A4Q9VUI4_9HYPH|nr:hypothetical protein [Siculibacillus lacustris]TBW38803.1 hypothetical protein EYW49_08935 [Siculibacillus lacustris]
MSTKIRSTTTMLGLIGDGELIAELDGKMVALNAALLAQTQGRRKAKAKGSITLTLGFVVEDGTVTISPDIAVKEPKPARANGFFWLRDDGSLSTEHPSQTRMDFAGNAKSGAAVVAV